MNNKLAIPEPKDNKPTGTAAAVRQELRETTLKTKKKIAAAFKAKQEINKSS